jgi:alginate O-acetyltransferase complex protein AlgI
MAIGLGMMMGFRFPENFNDPYTSKSITEFWKRWHMTLGSFIMNYLYIPLGGNRKGKGRTYLNLWLCFLLSGLWHGASWTFVLWGAFHGLFICLDKLLGGVRKVKSTLVTFFIVMMGWVLFRVDDVAGAGGFYTALFSFKDGLQGTTDAQFWTTLAFAVFFSFLTLTKIGQKWQDLIFAEHYTKRLSWVMFAISIVLLVLSTGALCVSDFNPFIYFRF